MAEVLFYLFSVCLGYELPLVAIQLLWLNIVTDGLQDMALSFEREEKEIMTEKPRSPKESIFDRLMFQEVMIAGFVMSLSVLGLWIFLVHINHFIF